jgi:calcineurin-like phosphoesterase family protein
MPNIFLISDTHFGHEGICKFTDDHGNKVRPFANAHEMDEHIIEKWNAIVKPRDKVYHLGDIAIKRQAIRTLERLNGEKVLIRGNHDIFKLSDYARHFKDIRATHRIASAIVMSHIPLHRDSLKVGMCNVHGHTHTRQMMWQGLPDYKYLNVCVEQTGYAPITLDEVMARVRSRTPDPSSLDASP